MPKAKSNLLLFTHKYPYGNQESFLENEIVHLSKAFDRVFIVPEETETLKRPVPGNVEILTLYQNLEFNYLKLFVTCFQKVIKCFAFSFFFEKKRLLYVYHIVPYLKYLLESIHRSRIMDRYIQSTNKSTYLFYTYWFLRGNLSLAFLQSQEKIPGYVSRAHGYDLYDEQQGGLIPFRIFKMKYIKYLFPVSKLGANYVKERIPKQFRGKVRSAYLGTKDHGLSPFNNLGKVTIVSCSNIIPLKRIPLIIDVLSHLNIQVNWHHFGDGISENQVKLRAKNLPKNVQYKFWGRINNTELIAFYKKNHITLFLNLSTTEGIPVSIMEAISFGIPVIATDVGGVHEIVNSQTGVLVDKDAKAENIADIITGFVNSDKNSEEFRSGVRQFWKRNFDAEKNYPHFITFLKNIDYQSV